MPCLALFALLLLPTWALAGPHVPDQLASGVSPEAQAAWAGDQALLVDLETQIVAARANVETARRTLLTPAQGVATQQDKLDWTKMAVDTAKSAQVNAGQRVDEATVGLQAAKVAVTGAKLSLKQAKVGHGDIRNAEATLGGKKLALVTAKRTLAEAKAADKQAGGELKAARESVGAQKTALGEARQAQDLTSPETQEPREGAVAADPIAQTQGVEAAQAALDLLLARRDVLEAQIQLHVARAVLVRSPTALSLSEYQTALSTALEKLAAITPR